MSVDSDPLLENLIVRNNIGQNGGGVTSVTDGVIIVNSSIYHNVAVTFGSGVSLIYSEDHPVLMFNTTVARNLSLGNAPGLGVFIATPIIINSIVYGNMVTDNEPDGEGNLPQPDFFSVTAQGFVLNSLIGGSGGSNNWQLENAPNNSFIQDGGGNLDEDPAFNDIDNNDFSLSPCSPAIDAGLRDFFEPGTIPVQDLAGNSRVINDKSIWALLNSRACGLRVQQH